MANRPTFLSRLAIGCARGNTATQHKFSPLQHLMLEASLGDLPLASLTTSVVRTRLQTDEHDIPSRIHISCRQIFIPTYGNCKYPKQIR
jgi:hypothetical protein